MPAIVVRNISVETHQALRVRARKHGRSTESEVRAILEGGGDRLHALGWALRSLRLRNHSAASSSRSDGTRGPPDRQTSGDLTRHERGFRSDAAEA